MPPARQPLTHPFTICLFTPKAFTLWETQPLLGALPHRPPSHSCRLACSRESYSTRIKHMWTTHPETTYPMTVRQSVCHPTNHPVGLSTTYLETFGVLTPSIRDHTETYLNDCTTCSSTCLLTLNLTHQPCSRLPRLLSINLVHALFTRVHRRAMSRSRDGLVFNIDTVM